MPSTEIQKRKQQSQTTLSIKFTSRYLTLFVQSQTKARSRQKWIKSFISISCLSKGTKTKRKSSKSSFNLKINHFWDNFCIDKRANMRYQIFLQAWPVTKAVSSIVRCFLVDFTRSSRVQSVTFLLKVTKVIMHLSLGGCSTTSRNHLQSTIDGSKIRFYKQWIHKLKETFWYTFFSIRLKKYFMKTSKAGFKQT